MVLTAQEATIVDRGEIYRVRRAGESDLPALTRMYRSMHIEYEKFGAPKVDRNEDAWIVVREEIIRPMLTADDHLVLIAVGRSGRVAGFISAFVYSYTPPYVGGIKAVRGIDLYVEPVSRGGTLAVRLQRAAVSWGKSLGCTVAEATYLRGNRSGLILMREGWKPYLTEVHKEI